MSTYKEEREGRMMADQVDKIKHSLMVNHLSKFFVKTQMILFSFATVITPMIGK